MSRTEHLLKLCDAIAEHDNVTHWAISARIFPRGDFFSRLKRVTPKRRKPVSCSVDLYDQAMDWFAANWPADLAWPSDVPRPDAKRSAA